jgi:YVTN family beta-propeller protein
VSIGTTTDHANGTYTALFTADSAGTATTIHATIGGVAVASTTTITVVPGNTVAAQSVITVSADTIPSGGTSILTLQAKDTAGNNITTGGLTVVFSFSGGTSTGTIAPSPATDHGDGTYTATFTGVTPGTATTIHATIGAVQVTSTLPTITVFSSVHVSNITADSTWTAAASPHIVNGYLKITNGAKLTVQAGAVVKFNAGSGLQVGDTAANQSGDLALDGTGGLITLTANSASPTQGFWKGIEVQRSLTVTSWRNVLIEWAGGTRAPAGAVAAEACILLVDNSGSFLELDSLHIRQCTHAGIHHFGGNAHVHRSRIDTVSGSGIHVDFNAQLELDSTTIRAAGQEGLFFGSLASRLLSSSANQFRNNAVTGIHLNAFQLPGLLLQDSIVGNGTNFIILDGGQPDPSAVAFTMFAQPQPVGLNGYLIQNGNLDIGRVGGQALTLDANVVLRFNGQTGLVIGDSAGTRSGTIRSLATSPANRATLNGSAGSFPGAWVGLEIGRLSGADTLRFVRIADAGDSISGYTAHRVGLWVRNSVAAKFVLDGANIQGSGLTGAPKNSAGVAVTGTGGFEIRNSLLFQNIGFGVALQNQGFKVVNDTIQNHTIGVATFMQGGTQLLASDSISGNTFPGTQYALSMTAAGLRALQANGITTAASDTLLLTGGLLTANATLPTFAGYVWHATAMTNIDSSAILTISPGDTIAFDSIAGILVGSNSDGGLAALGTAPAPILFTTSYTPSGLRPRGFNGVEWRLPTASGNSFTYVTVDQGGYVFQPQCDCSQIQIGALRFADTSQATTVNLTLDHITVRRSFAFAVDLRRSGTGTVTITNSQFYENDGFDPMIRAFSSFPNQLTVSGSDLYHYRGWVIQASDTVLATNNWWGDVAGPDSGFTFQDSLGRAALQFNPVRFTPFALTPFFPVGPAVGLVPTADSVLSPALSTTDSIRVRAVDAVGRGVAGGSVSWSVAPLGQSTISPTSGPIDAGGRADANWTFTTSAGTKIATASGTGSTQYVANVQPGLTVSRDWTLVGPLSQGSVTAPKAITFTSTNRRGVLITKSVDSNGNPTQAFYCTATPGVGCVGFSYAIIDSIHTSGGADGDSVFFHATVTTPNPFVLRGEYTLLTGGQAFDSVLITMNPAPAGVKIDRDEFTNGVQTTPDTAQFFSLCPGGQPNFYCEREFHAFVVDSGFAPIDNPGAFFTWNLLPPTGAPVTFTPRGAPANDTATVDAQTNGFARLVVTDVSSGNLGADTLPILVTQLPGFIFVTPPVDSVAVGGTATFVGTAVDLGGDTMSTVPIHWRIDNTFNPHLTIIDTATPHQVVVRLDSTPFGGEFITAFAVRGPGDTIYGSAEVVNPLGLQIDVGAQPWAITASAVTHAVYAGHQDGELFRIDGTAGTATHSVTAGSTISAVAVNAVTNRVYAATDSGVVVLSGGILSRVKPAPIAVGKNDQGVQNRQGLTVDSINDKVYVTVIDVAGASPRAVLRRIDGDTNGFSPTNDTPLPDTGNGAVFNPNDGFVYVTIPDSNLVVAVNPATHQVVQRISVGSEPYAIALNPITNRLYVIDQINTFNFPYNLYVIDPVAGAVTATILMGYQAGSLAVDAVTNRIYVGAKFFPYLTAIDGATNTVLNIMIVNGNNFSDRPLGVAVDAGNGQVYTANYLANTVTQLKF